MMFDLETKLVREEKAPYKYRYECRTCDVRWHAPRAISFCWSCRARYERKKILSEV